MTCPWSGQPCECATFPYRIDGFVPLKCESRMTLDMLGIRSVRPDMKKLFQTYLSELANETYEPADPKWQREVIDA